MYEVIQEDARHLAKTVFLNLQKEGNLDVIEFSNNRNTAMFFKSYIGEYLFLIEKDEEGIDLDVNTLYLVRVYEKTIEDSKAEFRKIYEENYGEPVNEEDLNKVIKLIQANTTYLK